MSRGSFWTIAGSLIAFSTLSVGALADEAQDKLSGKVTQTASVTLGTVEAQRQIGTGIRPTRQIGTGVRPTRQIGTGIRPDRQIGTGVRPTRQIGTGVRPTRQIGTGGR